jgi:hypothetical protein
MSVSVSQYSLLCAYVFVCCVGVSVWLWQERSDCTSSRELLVSKCRASLSLSLSLSLPLLLSLIFCLSLSRLCQCVCPLISKLLGSKNLTVLE